MAYCAIANTNVFKLKLNFVCSTLCMRRTHSVAYRILYFLSFWDIVPAIWSNILTWYTYNTYMYLQCRPYPNSNELRFCTRSFADSFSFISRKACRTHFDILFESKEIFRKAYQIDSKLCGGLELLKWALQQWHLHIIINVRRSFNFLKRFW